MHKIKRRDAAIAAKQKKAEDDKKKRDLAAPRTRDDALKREFKFWNSQPVTKLTDTIGRSETVDKEIHTKLNVTTNDLPEGYTWVEYSVDNADHLAKIAEFLDKYYVEDLKGDFRLHYTPQFIKWALSKPCEDKSNVATLVGVEVKESGLLVGFIASILSKNQVYQSKLYNAEIDFLCVHPQIRRKRLTPILINEIAKRVSALHGDKVSSALYTAGCYLPTPFVSAKYHHRPLDVDVLLETGFTRLIGGISASDIKRLIQLPKNTPPNFVKMTDEHVPDALHCMNKYFGRYSFHPIFDENEFRHTFLNNDFVCSYVVIEKGRVVDFVSFYKLPLRVINEKNNKKHAFVNGAHLYYYTSNVETIYTLITSILIIAKREGMHVFNALDIMENSLILNDLRFEEGTGKLNYYMYNYACVPMKEDQIAKFLL